MRRPLLAGFLAVGCLLAFAAPASANHHLMKIREVFAGAVGQPSAQFVELQMYAAGQNILTNKDVVVYDATGAVIDTFRFPANVANSANQATVLIATSQAASFFGVTADLAMTPVIPAAGGKVCFVSPTFGFVDCVSWGNYSGSSVGTGTPFNAGGGLVSGKSALRDISGGTNPTLLDAGDDTNDSAADFDLAIPSPRNNAGATTSTAGQAGVVGGSLDFTANAGAVNNNVTLPAPVGGFFTLRDAGAPVTPGAGCQAVGVNVVRCGSAGVLESSFDLGPGNDVASVNALNGTALDGGTGNDRLTGTHADDILLGGDGNDTLNGRNGPDAFNGNGGRDTVTYAGRTEALTVDIDGAPDDGGASDGPPGARDTVATDVENLVGGNGPDLLTGNGIANRLTGGLGADRLRGLAGKDTLIANDGVVDTEIDCGAGSTDVANTDVDDPPTVGCETVTSSAVASLGVVASRRLLDRIRSLLL